MTPQELDDLFRPIAQDLHKGHMQRLGIRPTMELALQYNQAKHGYQDAWRRELYRTQLDELLQENGAPTRPAIEMHEGWAIDTSGTLPHLDQVLADADEIIEERRGVRTSTTGTYRSYFQDLWKPEDAERYPSFVDFCTSSDVIAAVSHYLESIPALSTTLPSGIRFVESNAEFDDQPDRAKDSQLYHIDYYSLPNVYVLVLLQDTSFENGPWTFLPRSVSQRVREDAGYWEAGRDYRMSDEEVFTHASREDVIEFSYPRGTVLFIESSGCMHFGSRDSQQARFQLMYGYTGACRTDFSEVFMPLKRYPIAESDSRLRKLVLNKYAPAPGQPDEVPAESLPFLTDLRARFA